MKKAISILLILSFLLLSSCSSIDDSSSKKDKHKADKHDRTEATDSSSLETEGNLGDFLEGLESFFGGSSNTKEEESSGEFSSSDVPDTPSIENEYTITDFLSYELIDTLNSSISNADDLLESFNGAPDGKADIFKKKRILDMLVNANCIKISTIEVVISELNSEYDRVDDSRRDKISEFIDLYTSMKNETTALNEILVNDYADITEMISSDPELLSGMLSYEYDFNEKAAALIEEQSIPYTEDQNNSSVNENKFPPVAETGMWPVVNGYISSPYGMRIINGEFSFHSGTDIAAAIGTSVFASYSGTVISSGYDEGFGFYVLIYHGVDSHRESTATLYGHLETLFVENGMSVSTGDVIGKVGNSGISLGSHLHFSYFIDGDTVDPENYIPH